MTVEELRVVISAEFSGLKNAVKNSKKSLQTVEKSAKSVQTKLQNAFNINTSRFQNSWNKLDNSAEKFGDSINGLQGALARAQAQMRQFGNGFSVSGLSLSMGGLKKQINDVNEAIDEIIPKWLKLENQKLDKSITTEEYNRSLDELKKKYSEIWTLIEAIQKEKILKIGVTIDPKKDNPIAGYEANYDMTAAEEFLKNYSPQNELKGLESQLTKLKQSLIDQKAQLKTATSDFKEYDSQLSKIQKRLDTLVAKWNEATAAMRETGQQMNKVFSKADFESGIPGLKDINNEIRALKTSYNALQPSQEEARSNQEILTRSIAETSKQIEETKQKIKMAKSEIKKLGTQTKKTSKILNSFLMTAKFMAFSKIISLITKNLGECFNMLMQFDNAKDNIYGYNMAVSDLTSAFKRMSAEIAITMANIVSAIGPAITWILNLFSNAMEGINALIAAIQGKDKYVGVNADYWKNYAESIDGATKAQKKFLAGFDELTVLQDNTNKQEKPEDLFVEKDVSDGLKNMAKELAAVLALVAGYELLKKRLGFLANLFGKKNNLLDTQTGLTQKETAAVGALNPAYALAAAGALGLAYALEKIKMPQLDGVPDLVPALQPVLDLVPALQPAMELLPQLATAVAALAPAFALAGQGATSLVPQVEGVKAGILSLVPALATATASVLAFSQMPKLNLSVGLDTVPLTTGLATATALYTGFFSGLAPALEPLMQPVMDWLDQKWESINLGLQQEGATILSSITNWFAQVPAVFESGFNSVLATVSSFTANSYNKVASWASATAGAVQATVGNISQNVYTGLSNAGNNIVTFAKSTHETVRNWGTNVSQTFANVGNNIVNSISSACSSASASLSGLMSSVGSTVSGAITSAGNWISDHKKGLITAGAVLGGAALVGGSIALAPATGGLSLAGLAAFANGGVITTPTPALVGEYPGAKSNPEIIAPQDMMRETVEDANTGVVNAIYAIGNQISKAVEDKDTNVYMDGDKVSRKITKKQKEQSKYSSPSLVLV